MPNSYFQFKQFRIDQDQAGMKVTTDACLFGAWVAARLLSTQKKEQHLLDIGAGTGLLALMAAQQVDAAIDTIEVEDDAFRQAGENITASPWRNRIHLFHGDVASFQFTRRYDAIISNPPFYEREWKSADAKRNIAHHQGLPMSVLCSVIRRMLEPGGHFYLLLPYKRNEEVNDLLRGQELFVTRRVFVRQSPGHSFFRVMLEGIAERVEGAPAEGEITIAGPAGEGYTPAFTELLKDYYLYL